MSDTTETLPRWSVADVHESFESRSFVDAMEQVGADSTRLAALFDEHGIRRCEPRPVTAADGEAADAVHPGAQRHRAATPSSSARTSTPPSRTDSFDETGAGAAQRARGDRVAAAAAARPPRRMGQLARRRRARRRQHRGRRAPRPADVPGRARRAPDGGVRGGPVRRAQHTGSTAWERLHADVTSQLTEVVELPDGAARPCRWPRSAGWPPTPIPPSARPRTTPSCARGRRSPSRCAAAMNAVKGEANIVNRRRGWDSPLDASLFANNVSRPTFDAMQAAVDASLPDFRRWMRTKARLHGHAGALPWYDLFAPLPFAPRVDLVDRRARDRPRRVRVVQPAARRARRPRHQRAVDRRRRRATASGAARSACRSSTTARWCSSTGAAASTRRRRPRTSSATRTTTRNSPIARRCSGTCRWRWPRPRASSARRWSSRKGSQHLDGRRPAGAARRQPARRRPDGRRHPQPVHCSRPRSSPAASAAPSACRELNEMMLSAQADAYGDGLDQSTAHPYMWAVKPHYYGVALLQLAVHLRLAVRARPVRQVPRGPRALPDCRTTTCCRAPA